MEKEVHFGLIKFLDTDTAIATLALARAEELDNEGDKKVISGDIKVDQRRLADLKEQVYKGQSNLSFDQLKELILLQYEFDKDVDVEVACRFCLLDSSGQDIALNYGKPKLIFLGYESRSLPSLVYSDGLPPALKPYDHTLTDTILGEEEN